MSDIDGRHIYAGKCPDDTNGPYARDPKCPCCRALIWLWQYQTGRAVSPAIEHPFDDDEEKE